MNDLGTREAGNGELRIENEEFQNGPNSQFSILNSPFTSRDLPENLAALDRISMNFVWTWLPGGVELFRDLEPRLWDECEQNPRLLLKRIDDLTLRQWAADAGYI